MKKVSTTILGFVLLLVLSTPSLAEDTGADRYKISNGDILEISVWENESLNRQIVVPPDNIISYPLIGDVDVTGMTITRLREVLTEKIVEYVNNATVTVILEQPNSLKAYVIGKVNNPGQFPIDMNTTVMQILAMAGGLNPFASANKIVILRQQGGKTVSISFEYGKMEGGKDLDQNIVLQRGDVVVVP